MKIEKTGFAGLMIIIPSIYEDERGYFFESYNKNEFEINEIKYQFVQDNQAKSGFGVIRGLHYQLAPFAQTKLIRVLSGEIYDVVVDIRKNSPTFGKYYGILLSDANQKQLLIPKGFAHGYSVLSNEAVIFYKCDDYYNKDAERGIIYNDAGLNINWQLDTKEPVISAKDKVLPKLENAEMNFHFKDI